MSFTVAIDGPAAAGKGTIARAVAARFGFAHLDTGLIYRAVAGKVLGRGGGAVDEAAAVLAAGKLRPADLERDGLRSAPVSKAASEIASIGAVRSALLGFQRGFARRSGGAVLDGRDIGTVICPDAEVKLFVTADAEIRARRRFLELSEGGAPANYETVLADLRVRDALDFGRVAAPLTKAADAHLLDTGELAIDAAVAKAAAIVERAMRGAGV